MDSIIPADIFFVIASFAVVIITAVFAVAGIYLIHAFRNFRDVSCIVKRGAERAEENVEEAYRKLEESAVFRFLFGRRHARTPRTKKIPPRT